jgi:lipooligosaccharide transport system ATP-binding protein
VSTPDVAIRAQGLTKHFGDLHAVQDLDLEVPTGICFGFLGPNGAGKTTALRMMQGVSPLTAGRLNVAGYDVATDARTVRRTIGVVAQEDNLDPDFGVRENLIVYAAYYGLPAKVSGPRADALLEQVGLTDKADEKVQHLSGGMKRRLMVARGLINEPTLLMLDEPTTGLDPQARHVVWDLIRRVRKQGRTIVLTTHYMDEAELLCDDIAIVDGGRILARGAPATLIAAHAGDTAIEMLLDDEAQAPVLAALNDHEDLHLAALADRLILIGAGAVAAAEIAKPHAGEALRGTVSRRATLEDVFLRLTGRQLRDG